MSDIVKEAREAFRIAQDAENDNRIAALDDIKFARNNEQWDTAIEQERKLSGRPCLTVDHLGPIIRQVVNDARQNRPSIKVVPVDSKADPETAEVMSGIIRNIEAMSDADVAYDTAIDYSASGGFGYWRINLEYAMNAIDEDTAREAGPEIFDKNIFIRRVSNPFSVYGDPYSTSADSSDWNTAFVTDTMTVDQFKQKYPKAEQADFEGSTWANMSSPWKEGDAVQIAEYWKREKAIKQAYAVEVMGEDGSDVVVMFEDNFKNIKPQLESGMAKVIGQPRPVYSYKTTQYILNGAEELEKNPWAGCYIPIVPIYGDEINIEGKRIFRSIIRDAKDSQRMLNYWSTTATELVALAPRIPYIGRKGAFKSDVKKWSTANSVSHPFIEYDGDSKPEREQGPQIPAGVLQMLAQTNDDIKAITGIYDASLGARSNETSGKAIMARQREGDVSTFHIIDNQNRGIRHTGRILIDLMPKVYSSERMARMLGEDGTSEMRPVNQKYETMKDGKAIVAMHDLRVGRYDAVVSSGPSYTSRREEAAQQMLQLGQAMPEAMAYMFDLLAKNLDWPGADEIAKRAEKVIRKLHPEVFDEDGQLPPEITEQIQQMQQALQMLTQQLQKAEESKDIDAAKLAIDQYNAETNRLKVMQPAFGPEQVQATVLQVLSDLFTPDGLPDEEAPDMGQAMAQPEMAGGF